MGGFRDNIIGCPCFSPILVVRKAPPCGCSFSSVGLGRAADATSGTGENEAKVQCQA